ELLRSRGYIVEIELGDRNLNAFRWILMAMDEEFHIRDQMVGAMLMSLTAEEVLERMKEV
ncbi:MAG: hypothetical protein NTV30_02335, partial [Chloroflexi bacterium]|nr:hypothetical protein [Chloroflexota bacterium]